jgi:phosphoribosylformimino-5-aminoimidazole carboxamide ribotide isomerase
LDLIPVIDLLHGSVVHAREGRRAEYAPVRSLLCAGTDPENVMAALLQLHPFRMVYIADLDAIQGRGTNYEVLERLHLRFPEIELWVDTGIADEPALRRWLRGGLGRTVIGSENLHDAEFVCMTRDLCSDRDPVLSLDFLGEQFRGPKALLDQPERYWPQRVLAMNLQRVGSRKGPDFELIVELARRVAGCKVYAAGGVRSIEDLEQVQEAGAAGALIASALHDGRIGTAEIRGFDQATRLEK